MGNIITDTMRTAENIFKGNVNIDDPKIRQSLKNAFPTLADDPEINDFDILPAEYINKRIIPELMKLRDAKKIQELKIAFEANSKLRSLVHQFSFAPLPPGTAPSREDGLESIKDSVDSTFQDFMEYSKKLIGIENTEERKTYLTKQIIYRANRVRSAMDKTLLGAGDGLTHWGGKSSDGNYYGPHGGPINKWIAGDDIGELGDTDSSGGFPEVQEEIGNYDKNTIERILGSVVEQATISSSVELTIMPGMTEIYENKEQQMKAALQWLYAAEAGWEQNRDYINFASKWLYDNAIELGIGTIVSIGIGGIATLLAVLYGIRKFGNAIGKIPGMGLIKQLGPLLGKIPKYGPIARVAASMIPTNIGGSPTPRTEFAPETNTMHRAVQEVVLEEMWKTDKATQDRIINDIYTTNKTAGANLDAAGVSEATFKSEIRVPGSGISTSYPALRIDYEGKVIAEVGASLAPDFEAYKKSVIDGTDLVNKGEFNLRIEAALDAQAKAAKATSLGAQQQAQVAEGRAVAGDIKHPKNRVQSGLAKVGLGSAPVAAKPTPAHIPPNVAVAQAQSLRERAKGLEMTDVPLADGSVVKLTKLDEKALKDLTTLEGNVENAEVAKKKVEDRIKAARARLVKEQEFQKLNGNASVMGSIKYQDAEITRLQGLADAAQLEVERIEGNSTYKGKNNAFDTSKLLGTIDAPKYATAKSAKLTNERLANEARTKLTTMESELGKIDAERKFSAQKTEVEIRDHIGTPKSGSTGATGLMAELEGAQSNLDAVKGKVHAVWADLASKYASRIQWDATTKILKIDGVISDIKKSSIKLGTIFAAKK